MLINPFKAVACAAGLAEPRVRADVILASSRLLDEGAPVASGKFLVSPGSYKVGGLRIEGVSSPHDRFDGRRFGASTLWRWKQGAWRSPTSAAPPPHSGPKTRCSWAAPTC